MGVMRLGLQRALRKIRQDLSRAMPRSTGALAADRARMTVRWVVVRPRFGERLIGVVTQGPSASARDPGRDPAAIRPGRQPEEVRSNRWPSAGFDRETYKQRNTVERCINRLKQWRGLATRYDKTATVYLAGLHIAAIFIWSAR